MRKTKRNNIIFSVQNKLCTGCGVCEDVCPTKSITIKQTNGEYRPHLNTQTCLSPQCGKCLKVCPGVGVNLVKMAEALFPEAGISTDKHIGRYTALHTGYSTNGEIRLHSASGGMVSQFLIFLLEKGHIDGAVVTKFSDEDHITPVSYIARTREEVLAAKSSKYCPVSLNKVGNEIVGTEGRYVIVGLPCHIQGFRKRAKIDRIFRDRVVGMFSIYCSSGRTFYARDYIFRHYGMNSSNVKYFAFRDNGCLGYLIVRGEKNIAGKNPFLAATHSSDCTELKIPYSHYYGPMLRSFFKPHRCLTCIDHYGGLADVCFGDIHIKPYSDDKIGVSSWITRTEYWERMFEHAVKDGYIKMDVVDKQTLNDSQAAMLYPKKRRAAAVMTMDRILGRVVPQYDKPLQKPMAKDYVSELFCHAQRFVGRRERLWWIIDLINRKK